MSISIIVAMTDDRVIGKENKLPWHLSEDLKRFKEITMGHPIVMGRKTFESIGKPLPGRHNVVITHDTKRQIQGATVANSLDDALDHFEFVNTEIFVIGGASVYEEALPIADCLYLTLIHEKIEGDRYFPHFDLKKDYKVLTKTDHKSTGPEKLNYSFIKAERIS